MGRLDNIIARNRQPNRMHERMVVSLVLGAVVLLILALTVFTDLGLPPEVRDARDARDAGGRPSETGRQDGTGAHGTPGAAAAERGKRVDGVLLRVPPAKPAQR